MVGSERLFAEVVVAGAAAARRRRGGTPAPSSTPTGSTSTGTTVAAAPVVLVHGCGGPTQARSDLVGDDLDDRALLTLLGLPAALLEPAGDDDARPLPDRLGDVLGHL